MPSENLFLSLLILLLLALLLPNARILRLTSRARHHQPRPLLPRSPRDCPLCCQLANAPEATRPVTPWSQCKSSRGRPKSIPTAGHYCPNPGCDYFRIRDHHLHALVGDGRRGVHDPIQWFRCQACGQRFSQRRLTPMHHLKTSLRRVDEVVTALGEGVDQSAAVRIFKHHPSTIARWLIRFSQLDQPLHDHYFHHWVAHYIQLDELKAHVRHAHDVWVWIAFEARSKVILSLQIGPRTQLLAHSLIHDLKARLAPGCIPPFSSDGLRLYFYALTAHFGFWSPPPPGKRLPVWTVDPALLFAQLINVFFPHLDREKCC